MLPTAGPLPTGPGWRYEFKWDGIRLICGIDHGRVELLTRLGNDVAAKFPELHGITAVGDAVLDGELVVLTDDRPDWGAVIRRRQAKLSAVRALAEGHPATVMVFDVLALDGEDLRRRPYTERRAILESLELTDGWVVPPVSSDGPAMIATSLEFGLEGVIAKRAASRYHSGRRGRDWIKVKHADLIDTVVIGWERRASGGLTLLLAERTAEGGFFYSGRCTAPRSLIEVLEPLATATPPVAVAARGVQWVRPVLEVEVTAASRAPDGRLRQPRFVRPRVDQLG
jgi:bifunctional non-homologous end joining protein LigD